MARTRGVKSSSPSSHKKIPREEPVPDPTSEPPRPKAVSPPLKPAPPKPPARRYLTRSRGRPLQKRARVESSEPIDLTEQSPEPSSVPSLVPSPVPSLAPPAEPQEPQPPLPEPQNPSEITPEAAIRRPMLTQPPIEGNLDCRARPFHSELCFDIATFQLRPELAQAPPVTPASSQPSTSTEPRMTIPISEYRELCRSLETLTASQSSLAHEMAAIRLQHHFDLPPAAKPSTSTTAVPHSHPTEPQAPSGAATEEVDPSA
ncbi:proline-rich receptor-like protein kinase PERK2 [Vitis vinifera]|uniref:proline-rich receptor-like protein kinase PERK2 n=1 Tax=Vitis vinifera TaxID=29760 RepID=UPI0008FFD6DC|nr:proline-rich receptor-like protein kinase PERK2 [Vitis vinifera]|eukprot:XP_019075414.1 PREDICTED: proline-rich receptor-like protein kinase PERK2 [Vitis vinifera]